MSEQVQKERQKQRKTTSTAPTPTNHRAQVNRARRAAERRVRTGTENGR